MATQMQLKVLFGKKSHGRPDFEEQPRPQGFSLKKWVGREKAGLFWVSAYDNFSIKIMCN